MLVLRCQFVIVVCWWPTLGNSRESDSQCPTHSPCTPSQACHWFKEFKALGPGTVEYRERLPKVRQAVCNQEVGKVCCPNQTNCPTGEHCVNANNCSAHQKHINELRELGRGTEEYKEKKEQYKMKTIVCSKKRKPRKVCCSQLTLSDPNDLPCSCGCRPELMFSLFITGGSSSVPGNWPWMAVLQYRNQPASRHLTVNCGGSLISPRHILTAGHCVSSDSLGPVVRAVLGENDLRTTYDCLEVFSDCQDSCPCSQYRDGTLKGARRCWQDNMCADRALVVPVRHATRHPQFRREGKVPINDIAILTLERSVALSPLIIPICLRDGGHLPTNAPVMVIGWGNTKNASFSQNGPSSSSSSILQNLQQRVVSREVCSQEWLGLQLRDNQMCASSGISGKAGCQGDSGGPLVRQRKETGEDLWELVGIVSFGPNNCGNAHTPAVYTSINQDMLAWIKEEVGDQLPGNME